jgi:hypothetical protein
MNLMVSYVLHLCGLYVSLGNSLEHVPFYRRTDSAELPHRNGNRITYCHRT